MKSGYTTGTGAILPVEVGYKPSMVELFVTESSAVGFWEESMRSGTFSITQLEEIRAGDIIFGRHLPSAGSTDTQLANTRCTAKFDGAGATAIEVTATAAGTAFTATTHDVDAGKWASFLLSVQTGRTITITMSADDGYASEALAIAAVPSVPSDEAILGFITVKAPAGGDWDATTCSLAGGTSGTYPADETNYYEGYGVMSGGIIVYGAEDYDALIASSLTPVRGFTIGTSALLNIAGSIITWKAYRD